MYRIDSLFLKFSLAQLLRVEDGSVAVHDDHGGGEVEQAGGQHQDPERGSHGINFIITIERERLTKFYKQRNACGKCPMANSLCTL